MRKEGCLVLAVLLGNLFVSPVSSADTGLINKFIEVNQRTENILGTPISSELLESFVETNSTSNSEECMAFINKVLSKSNNLFFSIVGKQEDEAQINFVKSVASFDRYFNLKISSFADQYYISGIGYDISKLDIPQSDSKESKPSSLFETVANKQFYKKNKVANLINAKIDQLTLKENFCVMSMELTKENPLGDGKIIFALDQANARYSLPGMTFDVDKSVEVIIDDRANFINGIMMWIDTDGNISKIARTKFFSLRTQKKG